jgi:alkyl hydroperoxide reductase subunit AhpC
MKTKSYTALRNDIEFNNKLTVNKLGKIFNDLVSVSKSSKKLKIDDLNYFKGRYQRQQKKVQDERKSILDAASAYHDEVENINTKRTTKLTETYRTQTFLNHHFREYENDNFDKLNYYDGDLILPSRNFISELVINKLTSLRRETHRSKQLHVYITIKFLMSDVDDRPDEGEEQKPSYFNSQPTTISSTNQIGQFFNTAYHEFIEGLNTAAQQSNLTFQGVLKVKIKVNLEKSVLGRSYIDLPTIIKTKRACVNPINKNDDFCFKWCLLMSKYYNTIKGNSKCEVRHYKKFWDEIKEPENFTYPTRYEDIHLFENLNDIKINVYELDEDFKPKTFYTSRDRNKNVVNLLLIHDEEKSHYVWIKNISSLLASNTTQHKKHICSQCLTASYDTELKLNKHMDLCMKHESCFVELPHAEEYTDDKGKIHPANNKMKFKNHGNAFKHPFHIVADFESTLLKVNDKNERITKNYKDVGVVSIDEEKSTKKYQMHIPNSYGLKYNCIHDEHSEAIKIYNSQDPEQVRESFILELERLAKKSYDLTQMNKENIIMTQEQKEIHKSNKQCNECNCKYTKKNNQVRHHDHITGEFINSICYNCNIKLQYKTFLPVYIHNLKGYDSHLFVSALFKYGYQHKTSNNVSCIPNNEEKYISFSKNIQVGEYTDKKTNKIKPVMYEIRFLDSIAFMNTSIESLANNLKDGCNNEVEKLRKVFKNTSKHFTNDDQFIMMTEKGVYPYDYINTFDRMTENNLPPIQKFYSKLNNSRCSKEDYMTAKKVWGTFNCQTFLDYHNIYLVSDVLLLMDIWENFREVCYNMYNLDCEYYYTAPGLSFDAMLKYTKQELELITDLDMYLFVEDGIRGGISQISTRHAVANNKYMSNYEKSKEDSYIVYLDANNLYGYGMSTYLPTGNFKWNDEIWNKEKIMNLEDESNTGYLFQVDLKIPQDKHDYFNDYPLCPENISIKKKDLNGWQQENYKESHVKKLCLTLYDKKDYIINYRYLKLVLSLGYELENVNKVLQYDQSNFLKKYIDLNTDARIKAKNDFEKDFYKLLNNSVYGKTMENVRNRIDFRLIRTEEEALRAKNVKGWTPFNNDLMGLHIQKQKVVLNKPIYLGQNILDDSKVLMADFHYNFMKQKIDHENLKLLFTDTDSLCYYIKKQDIFEIIKNNKERFDLSNYPKKHELFDNTNPKAIGKMKNESPQQITEFIGLRSKLYSYKVDKDDDNHHRCKGVKRNVVNNLTIKDYENTLYNKTKKHLTQNVIRSYKHQLFSESVRKVALSALDDKRWIDKDCINTMSFGHKDII